MELLDYEDSDNPLMSYINLLAPDYVISASLGGNEVSLYQVQVVSRKGLVK